LLSVYYLICIAAQYTYMNTWTNARLICEWENSPKKCSQLYQLLFKLVSDRHHFKRAVEKINKEVLLPQHNYLILISLFPTRPDAKKHFLLRNQWVISSYQTKCLVQKYCTPKSHWRCFTWTHTNWTKAETALQSSAGYMILDYSFGLQLHCLPSRLSRRQTDLLGFSVLHDPNKVGCCQLGELTTRWQRIMHRFMTFIKNGDTFEEESKFHKIHFTQKSKKCFLHLGYTCFYPLITRTVISCGPPCSNNQRVSNWCMAALSSHALLLLQRNLCISDELISWRHFPSYFKIWPWMAWQLGHSQPDNTF